MLWEDVLLDIAKGKSTDEHWTRLLEDPTHGVRRSGYRFRRATRWMGRDNHAFVDLRYQKTYMSSVGYQEVRVLDIFSPCAPIRHTWPSRLSIGVT